MHPFHIPTDKPPAGDYVIFSCVADSDDFDLTHYMVFADASSTIYMGTYTASEPAIGELRYIFRLTGLTEAYPNGNVSYTAGSSSAVEGSDVFLVGDETRSKVRETPKNPTRMDTNNRDSSIHQTVSSTMMCTAQRLRMRRSTHASVCISLSLILFLVVSKS